jgi:molybdopterin molybdotransferase/putative molybdopterin biosynthesis protein
MQRESISAIRKRANTTACRVQSAARRVSSTSRDGNSDLQPHRIREISDLARPGLRIVNREPGAGARIALDEGLAAAGIKGGAIKGYDRAVPGHLEVAAAIASGTADAGITIRVAADAYRLAFAPIREERYDLLVAGQDTASEPLKALFDVLGSSRFAREIAELCSYDTSQMGKVIGAVN